MIAIILLLTTIAVAALVIGFFEIPIPFLISKAKTITKCPPIHPVKKVTVKQQKKSIKRNILYKKTHIGFMEMENSI